MKKLILPAAFLFFLTGCSGGEQTEEPPVASETEVTAPDGEFDPTDTSETEDTQPFSIEELTAGNAEEGTPVAVTGTVEELTDDGAFPAFILSDNGHRLFVRNMAETSVELGDAVSIEGIYDGRAEEDMPLVSATLIE